MAQLLEAVATTATAVVSARAGTARRRRSADMAGQYVTCPFPRRSATTAGQVVPRRGSGGELVALESCTGVQKDELDPRSGGDDSAAPRGARLRGQSGHFGPSGA